MDDILGSVPLLPPSISSIGRSQHNGKFQFPTTTKGTSSFGTLLEIQEHNLFDGMIGSEGNNITQLGCNSSSKPDLDLTSMVNPLKRTLPSSLYWQTTDEVDTSGARAGPSISKTICHGDHHRNDDEISIVDKTDHGNGSIATLFSQLPQTPNSILQQQQTMLGSIGDGVFRPPPYQQLSGLNWYT